MLYKTCKHVQAWLEDRGHGVHDKVHDEWAIQTLTDSKRNATMSRHFSGDPGADGWSGIAAPLLSAAFTPMQEQPRKYVHHEYKT